ncbi:MAG: response regulator [Deltaproteobacteria bacterium]|nr:response regulator [Deltaproteobacteria bacterium]
MTLGGPERWRPIAYTAIADRGQAKRIVDALHRQGYLVLEHATGFHLVASLADVIEGGRSSLVWPQLIVADVRSPGRSGASIANGLRDLGIEIPIILISGEHDLVPPRDQMFVVEAEAAVSRVPELAQHWSPIRLLDRPREPERMLAS